MMTPEQTAQLRDDLIAKQQMIVDQREANEQMVSATIRAQELTEQAEAAQARAEATMRELKESEERYRTLFDLCPAAVYSCDTSGVIQKFNRHAAELWGREPMVGDTDERFCGSFKLFRPDDSFMPHEDSPMADVIRGRISDVHDAEVLIERPDGSRVTVVVNIRSLKNQYGEVTAAINCFYDITDRKRVENRLVESLNQEQELTKFRELFVGILGHDLRNPLASIMMNADSLLRRADLSEMNTARAARIISSSTRMNRMIAQLLDLTRARLGGGLLIEPKPTDLREVCKNIVEEFEAPIQLEVEGDLRGTWDRDRLAEVLSNLTRNAIEYAAPETVVSVKARADGAEIVVEVSNRGDPISADVLPFIFEPFRQAQPRKKSQAGNLGLGLYIGHQIVLSHGGTLDAHCTDGTTTFAMRLPRLAPPRESLGSTESP